MALHFKTLPTELDPEQVKDYLFELQSYSKTPSQTHFKHTVYGLRFLLKTEGLPYSFLHLPTVTKVKKLPVILSREEIWRMLQTPELLKHKLLIGRIYGCGLRYMEVRNIEVSGKFFLCVNTKKKDILINKDLLCNKPFYVNEGLLRTYYLDTAGNEFTKKWTMPIQNWGIVLNQLILIFEERLRL